MAEAERLPHAIPFRLHKVAVTDHGEGDVARELRKRQNQNGALSQS